jgi:putative oxidoreductase
MAREKARAPVPQRLEGLQRLAVLILRLFLGFVFVMHGSQKLLGAFGGSGVTGFAGLLAKYGIEPHLIWAWVVAITEFVGGICVFFGFLTRFWAAGLVIDMTVAVIKVNLVNGFFVGKNGFELPLTFGVIALVILLMGPGSMSMDRAIGIEKRAT